MKTPKVRFLRGLMNIELFRTKLALLDSTPQVQQPVSSVYGLQPEGRDSSRTAKKRQTSYEAGTETRRVFRSEL